MDLFPVRKNIRLKGYDYSQAGYYFVTICVKGRREILGDIGTETRTMHLSEIGIVVQSALNQISQKYDMAVLDKYVIMPNHIHMILALKSPDGGRAMRVPTVSAIINQFKGYVTKQIGIPIWQSRFYEHIVRNEADYLKIWKYIDENPAKWEEDEYFTRT